jgi:hypothetical protein
MFTCQYEVEFLRAIAKNVLICKPDPKNNRPIKCNVVFFMHRNIAFWIKFICKQHWFEKESLKFPNNNYGVLTQYC